MARFTPNRKNMAGNSKTAKNLFDRRGYSSENYFSFSSRLYAEVFPFYSIGKKRCCIYFYL
jgi:hypothetical protein